METKTFTEFYDSLSKAARENMMLFFVSNSGLSTSSFLGRIKKRREFKFSEAFHFTALFNSKYKKGYTQRELFPDVFNEANPEILTLENISA